MDIVGNCKEKIQGAGRNPTWILGAGGQGVTVLLAALFPHCYLASLCPTICWQEPYTGVCGATKPDNLSWPSLWPFFYPRGGKAGQPLQQWGLCQVVSWGRLQVSWWGVSSFEEQVKGRFGRKGAISNDQRASKGDWVNWQEGFGRPSWWYPGKKGGKEGWWLW